MPGWKKRSQTASALACLLSGVTLQAAESVVEDKLPAAEFLEFLGEWEDAQGNWQDPMMFNGPEWKSLDDEVEKQYEAD